MSASSHRRAARCLAAMIAVVAGCAGSPRRSENLASRCYSAALIASEVTPMPEESIGICDHALVTVALSRRDQAATFTNRGILRLNQAAFVRAKEDFDQAIRLAPDLGETYVNRGAALLALRRYNEAIVDLDRAIALKSSAIEKAYYNRAVAHEMTNDIKGAYYDYLKAAEIRPDWSLPKRDLQRFKLVPRSGRLA